MRGASGDNGVMPVLPLHMGSLHAYEQVLTLALAFGPFLLLGLVVWGRRRADRAEELSTAGQPGAADPVLDLQGLDDEVVDQPLDLPADQRDPDGDVQRDGLGRRTP